MSDIFIILSVADAAALAGPTGPCSALAPLGLLDGSTYVLPVAVLADPAHAARWAALAALPQRAVAADEFVPPPT